MKEIKLQLTDPQMDFVLAEEPHPGMVAGYGAGKSHAAVVRIGLRALQYQGLSFGFIEPTLDLIRLIAWPKFHDLFAEWGVKCELNKTENIMTLENGSKIIFRSGDAPERLVGFEIADGVIDEIDTMPMDQAMEVWSKTLGRIRQKKPDGAVNSLGAVSTPEGFRAFYHLFAKNPKSGYRLIRAPSSSNPYLPEGYLDQLRNTYNEQQLQAYLDGEFCNMAQGSVYPEFDRVLNGTDEVYRPNEQLHCGIDLNVLNCSLVVSVVRGDEILVVDEVSRLRDTPTLIEVVKERYRGNPVCLYPDASGGSTKSVNASLSDIALMRAANLWVLAPNKNPAVKDRVLALNQLIHNRGQRRLKVNFERCPMLVEGLEQQAYDKSGQPDKSSGLDHMLDALGYFTYYRFGVARGPVRFARVVGI